MNQKTAGMLFSIFALLLAVAWAPAQELPAFHYTTEKDGSVCAALNGKILIFDSRGVPIRTLTASDGLPGANTGILYEGRSGILWGACRDGMLWRSEGKDGQIDIEVIASGLKHPIASIFETADRTLWVGSLGSGLLHLQPDHARVPVIYGSKNGLLGEIFWDVLEDREGNLWLAQNSGLSKLPFNFRAFQSFTAKSHPGQKPILPASGVLSVLATETDTQENTLWVGTENGLVAIRAGGNTEILNAEAGLTSNIVFAIRQDDRQRLWIATRAGVNCLSTQSDSRVVAIGENSLRLHALISRPAGLAAQSAFCLDYSPQTKTFWVGSSAGLNEIDPISKKVIRTVTKQNGLVGDNAWGIEAVNFGKDGTVYFGTNNGLNLYRPEYDRTNTAPPVPKLRRADFREDAWGHNEAALSPSREIMTRH